MFCDGNWIYYKEQCKYCMNKENCSYTKEVNKYIDAISTLEKLAYNVFGTTEFKCDYFVFNPELYTQKMFCEGGN